MVSKEENKPKIIRKKFCEVPECDGYAISDDVKICRAHLKLLNFFTWALNNIRISKDVDEIRTKSGLIIPK